MIIDLDIALYCFQVQPRRQRSFFLAQSLSPPGQRQSQNANHPPGGARDVPKRLSVPNSSARIRRNHPSLLRDNPHRLRQKLKSHAFFLDEIVLMGYAVISLAVRR